VQVSQSKDAFDPLIGQADRKKWKRDGQEKKEREDRII